MLLPAAHSASTTQTKLQEGINQKVSVCTQASHSRRVQNTDICNVGGEQRALDFPGWLSTMHERRLVRGGYEAARGFFIAP